MKNKIVIPILIFAFLFCGCSSDGQSEALGKTLFELLNASPKTSKDKIKALFISLKELKTPSKTELTESSQKEFDKFTEENIASLTQEGESEHIVWNEITYVKTVAQSVKENGIELNIIDVYFDHGVRNYVLKLIAMPHEKQLKIIRIVGINYAEE
ncbi:MAG: hypothetical protein AAF611_07150 [Bacteroidota bacterium]